MHSFCPLYFDKPRLSWRKQYAMQLSSAYAIAAGRLPNAKHGCNDRIWP